VWLPPAYGKRQNAARKAACCSFFFRERLCRLESKVSQARKPPKMPTQDRGRGPGSGVGRIAGAMRCACAMRHAPSFHRRHTPIGHRVPSTTGHRHRTIQWAIRQDFVAEAGAHLHEVSMDAPARESSCPGTYSSCAPKQQEQAKQAWAVPNCMALGSRFLGAAPARLCAVVPLVPHLPGGTRPGVGGGGAGLAWVGPPRAPLPLGRLPRGPSAPPY
jgi:hypothetical protein